MTGHILFWMSVATWLLMEAYVFFKLNRNTYKENTEKNSKLLIFMFILMGIFGPVLIDPSIITSFLQPFNGFRYVSIPLIVLGIIVRYSAIRQLGTSFSVNVGVPKGAELKKDGLYKYVRHPSYTGEFIMFLGVAVAIFHPVGSFFAFVFPLSAFLYRIHMEEQVLIDSFGKDYIDYQKQTKKIIPYIY
ncbi:methyltransferase family protein [Alkalibacterium kapii]|uniref:Uncharacterized protein n=1 Tax=Alkalibacterium kapii TaxID=426704 RepID=A0A511ATY5_9LACT|nr:isoprenylcysteine carboxylmethyltransferase family protein [Alkalibacterium kapii]GEK91649.1 hypothetical protein AKA01nite_12710 [Alkalibacterium kapii]